MRFTEQYIKQVIREELNAVMIEVELEEAADPCWDGYEQIGMKEKNGKKVPNCVPIQKESDTFGQHISIILSKENQKQIFIPKGFAHGFLTLSNTAIVNYKVDNYFSKEDDCGISFNDSDMNIQWDISESDLSISQKDLNLPNLKNLEI